MYAAVPMITPRCTIDRLVIVGETVASAPAIAVRLKDLGKTEVQHFHGAVGPQLDVRRLQVAMDDPLFVSASRPSAICRAIG